MKPCSSFRDRLLDVALGARSESTVSSHVESCPACREALIALRETRARMDTAVEDWARAEPSPGFRARVLSGIPRAQEAVSRWTWARVAAAAVVLVAAVVVSSRRATAPTPVNGEDVLAWRSPTESLLHSHADELFGAPPQLGAFYFDLNHRTIEDEHVDKEK